MKELDQCRIARPRPDPLDDKGEWVFPINVASTSMKRALILVAGIALSLGVGLPMYSFKFGESGFMDWDLPRYMFYLAAMIQILWRKNFIHALSHDGVISLHRAFILRVFYIALVFITFFGFGWILVWLVVTHLALN